MNQLPLRWINFVLLMNMAAEEFVNTVHVDSFVARRAQTLKVHLPTNFVIEPLELLGYG